MDETAFVAFDFDDGSATDLFDYRALGYEYDTLPRVAATSQ